MNFAFSSLWYDGFPALVVRETSSDVIGEGKVYAKRQVWTNSSVLALAGSSDPVKIVTDRARGLVMEAIQAGWSGPPYDPFELAKYNKISVVARDDIPDARTVPSRSRGTIEFNPNRPRSRVKYSICHELAHMLFPDWDQRVRNRVTHREMKGDEWQLETLCNIGAAELLMPVGSVPSLAGRHLTIDAVRQVREEHEVSAEAALLRGVRLTADQCCVFSASSRSRVGGPGGSYFIDYVIRSRSLSGLIPAGTPLPARSIVSQCIAIGFTAKGHEEWDDLGPVRIECLGVAPYPNQTYPRVLGIARPQRGIPSKVAGITYVQGDAASPRGRGPVVIAQVVNDSAFTWGAGFSRALRYKWPAAQRSFRRWAEGDRRNLRLGRVHAGPVDENLTVVSMVAQHGYGASPKPRIRYAALKECLEQLGKVAADRGATVHMPKIGSGLAGGSWDIVRELVAEAVCDRGVKVIVYELPGASKVSHPQASLKFPS